MGLPLRETGLAMGRRSLDTSDGASRSRRGWSAWILFVTAVSFAVAVPSWAAEPIATAVAVHPDAFGLLDGNQVTVLRGADLYEGQTITTSSTGQVQIVFADGTHLLMGPDSQLVIERYLMRDPATVGDLTVNALGGTFRWISGSSPSDSYHVTTPTGTIGFRGTAVDITVFPGLGRADFMVLKGIVDGCTPDGACLTLEQACTVASLGETPLFIDDEELRQAFAQIEFPYSGLQRGIARPFRVEGAEDCLQPLTTPAQVPVVHQVPPEDLPPIPPPPANNPGTTPTNTPPVSGGTPPPTGTTTTGNTHNNNGLGNGGEGDEGATETGNPGVGNGHNPH